MQSNFFVRNLLVVLLLISFSAPAASAATLKLCFFPDTGKIVAKRKCGKNQVLISGTNLNALIGGQSSVEFTSELSEVEGDVLDLIDSISNLTSQLNSMASAIADINQDISTLSDGLPAKIYNVRVNDNATILRSSDPVSVLRVSLGFFRISFDRDISNCYFQVTPTASPSQAYPFGVDSLARIQSGFPKNLEVFMYNSVANASVDLGFTVTVSCLS
ncbi:MAG: hypothetical protein KDD64_04765 [Bdellovibrionales bacterium]|nr:hypothetical protein [Bdellovibrionales bacterium]